MATEKGVDYYTHGSVEVQVHFPEERVQCRYCPLCLFEKGYQRYSCIATGEWLLGPTKTIGYRCPINFENRKEPNYGSFGSRDR